MSEDTFVMSGVYSGPSLSAATCEVAPAALRPPASPTVSLVMDELREFDREWDDQRDVAERIVEIVRTTPVVPA